MPCECCQNARIGPAYATHDPTCIFFGARLIWRIQRFQIPREQKQERCRKVLADWMEYGHSEAEIRRMAKLDSMPLEPPLSTGLSTARAKNGK